MSTKRQLTRKRARERRKVRERRKRVRQQRKAGVRQAKRPIGKFSEGYIIMSAKSATDGWAEVRDAILADHPEIRSMYDQMVDPTIEIEWGPDDDYVRLYEEGEGPEDGDPLEWGV